MANICFSQFWKLEGPRSKCLVGVHFLQVAVLCPHVVEIRELLGGPLYKGINPIHEGPILMTKSLHKSSNSSSGLGFQHMNYFFGGTYKHLGL